MKDLFTYLCNFSVITSIAIVIAVILRPLLKKGPSFIRSTLWVLVFLRLLIPVEFLDMPFSVPTVFETEETVLAPEDEAADEEIKEDIKEEIREENGILQQTPSAPVTPPVSGTVTDTQKPISKPVTDTPADKNQFVAENEPATEIENSTQNEAVTERKAKVDIVKVLSIVWAVGAVLMLGYMLISNLVLKYKVKNAVVYDSKIRILGKDCSPFVFGFFRPIIYIPATINKNDWEHIIAHESSHIKRLDHIVKPLAFITLCLYWFNPLVWLAYVLLSKDIEYACDERTVKNMEEGDKKAYSMALLSASQQQGRIFAPLSFGKVNVKERIKRVMKFKNTIWAIALTAVICTSLIAFIACNPAPDGNTEFYDEVSSESSEESAVDKTITIYIPDSKDAFNSYETQVIEAEPTAENIVRYCIEKGNFPEGSEMLSFEIRDRIGYLDMNSACFEFSNTYHDNFGIPAVHKIFMANLDIDRLVITYDGDELSFDPSGGETSEGLVLSVEELDVDPDSVAPDYADPSMGIYDRERILKIQTNQTVTDFKLLHVFNNNTSPYLADVLCELDTLEANKPFYVKRQEFPGIQGKGVYFKDKDGKSVIARINNSSMDFEIIEDRVVVLENTEDGKGEFVVYDYDEEMPSPEDGNRYLSCRYPYKRPDDVKVAAEIIVGISNLNGTLAKSRVLGFEINNRVGYLNLNEESYSPINSWQNIGINAMRMSFLETFKNEIDRLVITYNGIDPTAENPTESNSVVFKTDNITRITFYQYYGNGIGANVEEEHMEGIINWLKSFTVGKKLNEGTVPPGSNFMYVEIEYTNGTVVKKPLNTIVIDDVQYYLEHDSEPTCLSEILSRTKYASYKTTEERTNYALKKTYTMAGEAVDADYAKYGYLGEASGDYTWCDYDFNKLTDGVVGVITSADYASDPFGIPGVTVMHAGTNRLFEYIIDLGDHYEDINHFVFRNVRIGGNSGFKVRAAYVSDDKETYIRVTGTTTEAKVNAANNEYFDCTYTLDTPAMGRYVRILLNLQNCYVLQLEEIEVWNK